MGKYEAKGSHWEKAKASCRWTIFRLSFNAFLLHSLSVQNRERS